MLMGEAVVAIWNGIAEAGRAEFYAWHLHEHMPERVGIPGFRRGRRYIALDGVTRPEFFTLYEADTFQVLQGRDYTDRLNAPTPWTKTATAHFQDTSRALARVVGSDGPGMGGVLLTVRLDVSDTDAAAELVRRCAKAPRVCGAHLCVGDMAASDARTAESRDRTDIQAPPTSFALVEATDAEALCELLPDAELARVGCARIERGVYRLEYVRVKTGFA